MKSIVLTKNPSFAILKNREQELLFSLYGKIKLLRGATFVITAILEAMTGEQDKKDLISRVALHYPEKAVSAVVDDMIRSGILTVPTHKRKRSRTSGSTLGCMGTGKLAETVASQPDFPDIRLIPEIPTDTFKSGKGVRKEIDWWINFFENKLSSLGLSALAVCPENMSYLQLCAVNRACLNLRQPWVLGYFNGSEIALGPTIIPFKTPCLECLLEHRLRALNPSIELGWENFLQCAENFPFPDDPAWQGSIHWAAWLMAAELENITSYQNMPRYMKKQVQIPMQAAPELTNIEFETITTCPGCQGMNRGFIKIAPTPYPDAPDRVEIPLEHKTARHGDNGLRSMPADEARDMLDRTLGILKTSVRIEQCRGGMLDELIPSFRSCTSEVYSPDLPFNISEHKHWGKGMNERQAYLSAGFELMERICAEYGKPVEMLQCPYGEVKDYAIDLNTRVGRQYYRRNVDAITDDTMVDWVWGWSLVNRKCVLVPASMVYLTRAIFQGKFIQGSSSGLAAGTSMEDAVLQGLLETVEHDARYIWQANYLTPPRITGLPPAIQDIAKKLKTIGCELIIRNQTIDLGVHVIRAWIVQPDNPLVYAASGLGASLNPKIALYRAVSEAKQSWPCDHIPTDPDYASKNNTDLFGYNTSTIFMHHHDNVTEILAASPEVDYGTLANLSSGSISQDIQLILDRIGENVPNHDVIVVNLTREEFGIPVVRVIASGLQNPSQPLQNFPQNRLFDQPVKLGLRNERLSFKELFNDCHQE
ncbi:YcaO-like family protein [Pseudodesulfovibrio alkaliphilus]|nr:YcaO-like family protein [Pseudodesulfovibrio alkaliphilus]